MVEYAVANGVARVRFPVGAFYFYLARLAQLAARRSHNPKVASSILALSNLNSYFFEFRSIGAVGSAWVLCTQGPGFEPLIEHFFRVSIVG